MGVFDPNSEGLKYEFQDEARQRPRIKVIGVGGGGCNAVAHMMDSGLEGVEFHVINTDLQALQPSPVPNKLAVGLKVTGGQGAGADPAVGRQAALEDTERIVEILEGADMVFVTAGLGSGTGTGAAPVVCSLARELNALTVAVVTKPFSFEGISRLRNAERGLAELAGCVDTLMVVPNDRLLALAPRGTSLLEGFRMANDILRRAVAEIVEIVRTPGLINRDFSDIRSTLRGRGSAMMGTAVVRGENAAVEAARQAMSCPLVEDADMSGARNILVHITGSSRLGLHELSEACTIVREAARCDDVEVNFGIVVDESMDDAVKVTIIATGFRQPPASDSRGVAREEDAWAGAPAPASAPPPLPPPQAEAPAVEEIDFDDLDTPAFMRQRKVIQ